jgi:hypothetical protein
MFSHIIIFGSSLPEARGGHSLCTIICGRVLTANSAVAEVISEGYPVTVIRQDRTDAWRRYDVGSGPTFIFIADGKEQSRHVGSLTASRIKAYWQKINW